jgi:large subunit ribosomal protein L29
MAAKPKDVRGMSPEDRAKLLTDTRAELMHERGLAAMGGSVKNPGKIRDLRTTIARILTVERELGERGPHDVLVGRGARAAKAAGMTEAQGRATPKAAKPPKAKVAKGKAASPKGGSASPKGGSASPKGGPSMSDRGAG